MCNLNHRKEHMIQKNNTKNKRGFTIIEVVLVLAIAGLIFLMVFIAFPALQRAQRNTQRRDDYSMLVAAVNTYMSSNNGKLSNLIKTNNPASLSSNRWINGSGDDPTGNPYELKAYSFAQWAADGSKAPTDVISETQLSDGSGSTTSGSQVFIIIKGNCNGIDPNGDPMPEEDNASRSFAVYGYLEGGGYFCQDSGATGSKKADGSDKIGG